MASCVGTCSSGSSPLPTCDECWVSILDQQQFPYVRKAKQHNGTIKIHWTPWIFQIDHPRIAAILAAISYWTENGYGGHQAMNNGVVVVTWDASVQPNTSE